MTYQGHDINRYTFYTKQQDKKITYENSGVVLMLMMLRAKTKICTMVKRSGSLTFTVSRFLFFVAPELMESRVLYKTSTSSLALTLTIKDIS
jgi:hypothetical protein